MMAAPRHSSAALVVLFFFFISKISAVDKNNFKTCDQSGFCKRQRDYKPESNVYNVLLDTVTVQENIAKFDIKNMRDDIVFVMTLHGYEGGVVRVHMNEKSPLKPRYEVPPGDVVLGDQPPKKFSIESRSKEGFVLLLGADTRVSLSSPFVLEISSAGVPVLRLNSRNLLKFEHIRQRPGLLDRTAETAANLGSKIMNWVSTPFRESAPADEPTEEPAEDEEESEDAGEESPVPEETVSEPEEHAMWEETYKTHKDSKPNGPTSVGIDISFIGFNHVYGIPEHADSFALKSTVGKDPYRLYNLDVFEYDLHNGMALYGSVPVMLAQSAQRTVGVFWNNPSEMWIDITSSKADKSTLGKIVDFVTQDNEVPQMDTRWFAESGVLDLYVMLGPKPKNVFRQYGQLTGTTSLPPLFSLAYHQCRWNYNDEADVKQIHDNFDAYDIPLDMIWLDIEHTDGKRYFTWDSAKFPQPTEMVANLTAKGRKLVTIVDPHIKRDDNYGIYTELRDKDMFIKNKDGHEFDGWCWPGSSSYPDFTMPEMRNWWASKFSTDEYKGSTVDVYTWNDMNEPSVFNGPEITMHKDTKHVGGWEHRDVHNLYGFYVHEATALGQVKRSDGKLRPFVLTRSFYAGSQRHGAVWTGDNMGEWDHLKISIPMVLSLSVTGITFSGADIGGFFRNPSAELVTRWYQTAAWTAFFRAHSHLDTRRREPWLLAKENRDIIRDAIKLRYSLLPYWYTLFFQNELDNMPPTRPMWVEFPEDESMFGEEEQFMLGSALMVRPVTEESLPGVTIYFPGGKDAVWYDADDYSVKYGNSKVYVETPLTKNPHYYRGGYIIPRKDRTRRSTQQMTNDPYTLIVALDKRGEASGDVYIDDYQSFQYREGQFLHRQFTFEDNTLTNRAVRQTNFKTDSWLEAVKVIGLPSKPQTVVLNDGGFKQNLSFNYDATTKLLVVRKPAVNIGGEWSIVIQ